MNDEIKTECMELCVTACEKFSQNNEVRSFIFLLFNEEKRKTNTTWLDNRMTTIYLNTLSIAAHVVNADFSGSISTTEKKARSYIN